MNTFRLAAAFLALGLTTAPALPQTERITLDFERKLLWAALSELTDQAGLCFAVDPAVLKRLGRDVQVRDVPLAVALDVFAAVYEVCVSRLEGAVRISSCGTSPVTYH